MSPYEFKVTEMDVFPIKVCDSKFLNHALDSFSIVKPIRKNMKKLIKVPLFRKAYTYLFWLVIALKFRERTFGDMDHFNGKDETIQSLKDDKRMELYRLMEEDLILGQSRRIRFIKYWRHKFQNHFYELRNKQDKLFTKAL